MFEGLRGAFSSVARNITEKKIEAQDVDSVINEIDMGLLKADVAIDVIDIIKSEMRAALCGASVKRSEVASFVQDKLIQTVSEYFEKAITFDLVEKIKLKRNKDKPFVIVFVGINGTGKTTTLAKIVHMLNELKISVCVAAADTFRAGAIEQLRTHTDSLGVKLVAQNYGSDPAAVARDAILYSRSHGIDCVLIDTAGRMQTNKNLMDQISKIVSVVTPDLKIFVGDSLAGNDTTSQACEFNEKVGIDAAILTKVDGGGGGGAALSIVKMAQAPILYTGTGQSYDDLMKFDANAFVKSIFESTPQESLSH